VSKVIQVADGGTSLPEHEQDQLPNHAENGDAVQAGHKDDPLKHNDQERELRTTLYTEEES
jgi:hypothetical protein